MSTNSNSSNDLLGTGTVYEANLTLFDVIIARVAGALNVYYTPLLVLFGSVGNLLSVFVFFSTKLRLQSTSQYLSALAISDTLFLYQLLPPWLNDVQFSGMFHLNVFCQLFAYTSYVTCTLSAWLVAAFTVERYVAVLYPLRLSALCTVTRARLIIGSLLAAALILNLPVLRFVVPSENDCSIDSDYLDHAARFNLIDTALSFTVPLAMIVVLNAWIVMGVCRLGRVRHHLVKAHHGRGAGSLHAHHRVTRMLLIVSSVFVALNLPAYTLRVLAYAYDMSAAEYTGRWAALQQLALTFFNSNFGINFMLYCLSGQNFRRALKQCVPWLHRRTTPAVSVTHVTCQPVRLNSASTSLVSHCTEGASNGGGVSMHRGEADCVVAASALAGRRSESALKSWTFYNCLKGASLRSAPPAIEMQPLPCVSLVPDYAL